MDALRRRQEEALGEKPLVFLHPPERRRRLHGSPLMLAFVFIAGVVVTTVFFYFVRWQDNPSGLRKPAAHSKAPKASVFHVVGQDDPQGFAVPEGEFEQKALQMAANQAPDTDWIDPFHQPSDSPLPLKSENAPLFPEKFESKSVARELQLANSARFKLQGVRWSKSAERRIAVINNQILHQGGFVDGAEVISIIQEGVILEEDGVRLLLGFSR